MQLNDKDLLSIQETRDLIAAAKKAQSEIALMDQGQVDKIVKAIADAGERSSNSEAPFSARCSCGAERRRCCR